VELPGVNHGDITIRISENRAEIRGTKHRPRFQDKVTYLRLEREYGPFRRFVAFPCAVIPEKSRATLENGVLLLSLKKYRSTPRSEVIMEIGQSEE
jgi:HSP20 family protein